jgi:hypothetical protein
LAHHHRQHHHHQPGADDFGDEIAISVIRRKYFFTGSNPINQKVI